MMAESDLLILFSRESLDLVPVAWKELHERFPTSEELEAFLSNYADEPYRYRPDRWYRFLPKTGDYLFRDIDADSVEQWIWYFSSGDGFKDCQLDAILARALDWALGQGVASITLTFPPVLRNASRRIWWASGRRLRMRKVMDFMRVVELETGILVGTVAKKAGVKNG